MKAAVVDLVSQLDVRNVQDVQQLAGVMAQVTEVTDEISTQMQVSGTSRLCSCADDDAWYKEHNFPFLT